MVANGDSLAEDDAFVSLVNVKAGKMSLLVVCEKTTVGMLNFSNCGSLGL